MFPTLSREDDLQSVYAWFAKQREMYPLWLDDSSGCWHVFRYADVHRILSDSTLFSSERPQRFSLDPTHTTANGSIPRQELSKSLIAMDPPQHRQYRGLVSAAFTPRAIAALKDRIAAITQELLDQVRQAGQMDLVADLAYPLPTIVIAELLGVPVSDRPHFKRWADILLSQQLNDAEFFRPQEEWQTKPELQRLSQTFEEMHEYFVQILQARCRDPRQDVMSALLAAEIEGHRLSQEEVISFCILLLLAGHVTTTNLLSQAIRCFDEHPEVFQHLRCQPEVMPNAIEEVLRYASPVWRLVRTTRQEVEIAGTTLPKGTVLFCWLASANRDETQFVDPERFDIHRTPNKHLAFGYGIHFCIGAPLSRLEASIALPMLIEQLPHVQRDRSVPLEVYEGRALFGFKRLPVVFTPSVPVRVG